MTLLEGSLLLRKLDQWERRMAERAPLASIIIPCRNEAAFIDRCLASVLAFRPPEGGFEVLVVDGASTDGTAEKVGTWIARYPNVRLLDNPERIVPPALNLAIRASRGDPIVRLDAHSEYPADYLLKCVATSVRTGAANVGGLFVTVPRDQTRQAALVQAVTTHRFGVGNAGFRLGAGEGPADTVPYGCFRRSVFDEIGFFDERLVRNQDYEFNRRILASGRQVWRSPEIEVRYFNQGTIAGLLRQAFTTAKWNTWMWYLAPYSFSPRHAVPGIFFVALSATLLCSFVSPVFLAAFVTLLVAQLVLGTVSGATQARRYGPWMAPVLPFLFLAYHLSYGFGTVLGAVRLLLRKAPVSKPGEPWKGAGVIRIDPSRIPRP